MARLYRQFGLLKRPSACFARVFARLKSSSTESEKLVEVDHVGQVMLIGINRPQKRNSVNHATAVQLIKAFKQFEEKEDSLVGVLYGVGGCFCGGYDLKEVSESGEAGIPTPPTDVIDPVIWRFMGPSRMELSKPLIAAVAGYAVAGGLELALMCDLRIVEESAIMGVFCRRFGVPLIDGGTVRLPQLIGLSRAMDLILTGREVKADEAERMGLANRLVQDGTALGESIKLGQRLCSFPQQCMGADRKSALYSAYDATSFHDAFENEFKQGQKVLRESMEGAQQFVAGKGRHGKYFPSNPKSKI